MRLKQALDEKKFDVRLRDKFLAEGKLSNIELEKYQNSLEDNVNLMTYADVEEKKEETVTEE